MLVGYLVNELYSSISFEHAKTPLQIRNTNNNFSERMFEHYTHTYTLNNFDGFVALDECELCMYEAIIITDCYT